MVPHPAWGKPGEALGIGELEPTQIFNGRGEFVADFHADRKNEMIAQRILAVLAATFLVGAVAVATLEPPLLPLGQALLGVDHDLLRTAHDGTVRYLGPWIWDDLAQPVLARPAWLMPASLGLIFAGMAFSFSSRTDARRHRRS